MIKTILYHPTFLLAGIFLFTLQTFGQGKVVVTSIEKNYQLITMNCGCPKDENGNAFTVDAIKLSKNWNDMKVEEFTKLLTDFENENGVDIKSKSKTKDFRLQKDAVKTECVGPLSGAGKKLCDFLRKNI